MAGELLTVREVAQRLKVNPQTVRRWIKAGILPASRVGTRQWRVRGQDVERREPPEEDELARRREVVRRIEAMAQRLRGRGINLDELMAENRRDLEDRGALRGH